MIFIELMLELVMDMEVDKWRHLVAKIATNARIVKEVIQVAPPSGQIFN